MLLTDSSHDRKIGSATSPEASSPVDLERLYLVMGDEPEELAEILSVYLDQMSENLEKLDAAIAAGNAREVDMLAHNCAGVSATCGAVAVVEPLRELERMGRENQLGGAAALHEQTQREFARIRLFLQERLKIG